MRKRSPPDLLPLSVAVLLGGESRRFGSPKAFQPYRGKSMAAHLLETASGFSAEVFAVGREPGQLPPDARGRFPWAMDLWKEQGPLSGLHGALARATQSSLFLCAVDMPFLAREVVGGLHRIWEKEGRPDAVVPKIAGRWEPLCALWGRTTLGRLEPGRWDGFQRLLSEGPLVVREVTGEELGLLSPGLECLRNFNTPGDWAGIAGTTDIP